MLQERIWRRQQAKQLEQRIATMPAYPIYRETPTRYSIYVNGRRRVFRSEAAARLGQIIAREQWLRAHG